tara:strand:+ start:1518 stop:1955 length:438 start_codon:yes stop_codon:yes gene_type:complete
MSIRTPLTSFGGLALLSLIAATQSLSQSAAPQPSVSNKIIIDRFSACTSQADVENDNEIQNLSTLLMQYDSTGIDVTDGALIQTKLAQEYGEAYLLPGINRYYTYWDEPTASMRTVCINESKIYLNRSTDPDPLIMTIRKTVNFF